MVPRQLGRTGISVSRIGLGTTKLGRNSDVKYPQAFELPNDVAVRALIDATLEAGINLIDTAPAYGTSEERLGSFLETSRNRVILCTKCGENYEQARSTWDFSALGIERSLDRSSAPLKNRPCRDSVTPFQWAGYRNPHPDRCARSPRAR